MFIIFGLKSMIKQLFDLVYVFLHLKCVIKQLLESVFVICKIISVSVRVISLAFGSAYLDIDNSAYISQKPHLIIVYYTSKNPCRVSHAMRPGFKVAVKCILCIGSGNNKGGEL